ncbi:hypothetical protein ATANTOWER_014142 [Ataeniobius toweri]|uniref:Uncharacterized protein n=1 Tax=Ataeniobius toweri TaxID=208326 RepID=A0ABU7C1I7_9TELE|nr:hypothetical protein [Ataeniobius toweri]
MEDEIRLDVNKSSRCLHGVVRMPTCIGLLLCDWLIYQFNKQLNRLHSGPSFSRKLMVFSAGSSQTLFSTTS